MAQKLFDDNIGTLTNNGSSVTINGARITLGGQQYVFDGVSENYPALSAATQYYVYAVLNSGTAELRVSTNNNDTGPAGFTDWRLVGSFITDNTPAFLAFIDSPRFLPEPSNSQKPIKYQTKVMTGDETGNNTDLTDLTFAGLDTSKVYRLSGKLDVFVDNNTTVARVKVFDGANGTGNQLLEMTSYYDNVFDVVDDFNFNLIFKPSTSSIYFHTNSFNGQDQVNGDGTTNASYATLEELPNHVETDEWT